MGRKEQRDNSTLLHSSSFPWMFSTLQRPFCHFLFSVINPPVEGWTSYTCMCFSSCTSGRIILIRHINYNATPLHSCTGLSQKKLLWKNKKQWDFRRNLFTQKNTQGRRLIFTHCKTPLKVSANTCDYMWLHDYMKKCTSTMRVGLWVY